MEYKFEDFTEKERQLIAEFVCGYYSDILIKSDAIDLLNVMFNKNIINKEEHYEFIKKIEKNHYLVVEDIIDILFICVPEGDGTRIMEEYYNQ